MLEIRRLRILYEVGRRGTIAAAADALHYTPSSVSEQLVTFERELGMPLVERGPRSVTLTQAGRVLVAHAEEIFEALHAAEAEARAVAELRGGKLRLGSFPSATTTLVPAILRELGRRHPELATDVVEGEPPASVRRIRDGALDVALVYDYPFARLREEAGLSVRWILDDPIRICLPERHPLAAAERISLGDLAGETWLAGSLDSLHARFTVAACRDAGFEPSVRFHFDEIPVLVRLIADGAGVALLQELGLDAAAHPVAVRPVADGLSARRVGVAHRATAHGHGGIAAVLEAARAVA